MSSNSNNVVPDVSELIGEGLQSIPAPISVPTQATLEPLLKELVQQDPGMGEGVAKAQALYVVHIEQGVKDHEGIRDSAKKDLAEAAKSRIHQLKDAVASLTSVSGAHEKLTEEVKKLRRDVRSNAHKAGLILDGETPGEIQMAIQKAAGLPVATEIPEEVKPESTMPAVTDPAPLREPKAPGRLAAFFEPIGRFFSRIAPWCSHLLAFPPSLILGITLGTMADMVTYLDIQGGVTLSMTIVSLVGVSFGLIYCIGLIYEHIGEMIAHRAIPVKRQARSSMWGLIALILLAVSTAGVEVFIEGIGLHELATQRHEARSRYHQKDKKMPPAPEPLRFFVIGTIVSLPYFGVKALRSWKKASREQMVLKNEEDEEAALIQAEKNAESARLKAMRQQEETDTAEATRQSKIRGWLHNSPPAQAALTTAAELEDIVHEQAEKKAEYDRLAGLVKTLKEPLQLSEETLAKFKTIEDKVEVAKTEFARLTGISLEAPEQPEPNGHKPTLADEIDEKFPDGLFARRDGHPDNSPLS